MSKDISELPHSIAVLAAKRKGGRVNHIGIDYQLRFAIYKTLSVLLGPNPAQQIRLEGIEDVDVLSTLHVGDQELYQLKRTTDPLTSSKLWDMGVLQNFLETYLLNPDAQFFLVVNQPIKESKLKALFDQNLDYKTEQFWQIKIDGLRTEKQYQNWTWTGFDLTHFLTRLKLQVFDVDRLKAETDRLVCQFYFLTNSTHPVYLNALFHRLFQASQLGEIINRQELITIGLQVSDLLGAGTVNPAIQQRLIEAVNFEVKADKNYAAFFDGIPAQPAHIAAGLPVARPKMEKQLLNLLNTNSAAVVKASSGQGKSTLAWQVSYRLYQQGRAIYQLHSCASTEVVGGIVDYLSTRVIMGQAPLVVVDGLMAENAEWTTLASRLQDTPVQFLVTTREEDWIRFGQATYRIQIGEPLNLNFNRAEAGQVYDELKRRKLLSPECGHWQTAWERVQERGLLIEYVYLLTRGEMLVQRLAAQVREQNAERDGGAKLAMLRLIALADDVGVPLKTHKLRKFIRTEFALQNDVGELLRQLEDEYFIQFDRQYVEGLHPVRSFHLTQLLHQYIPVSETLLILITLIEEGHFLAYGKALPQRIGAAESTLFYQGLSQTVTYLPATALSDLLLGIYQGEIRQHYLKHKAWFDAVHRKGGYELFTMMTVPFPHENTDPVDLIQMITQDPAHHMHVALREVPRLTVQQTALATFVPMLYEEMRQGKLTADRLEELMNWFVLFDLPIEFPEDELILNWLETRNCRTGLVIAHGLQAINRTAFLQFAKRNIDLILSWLLLKTNTLTIEPCNSRLVITYLLLNSNHSRATDESVERINTIHAWLPQFEIYETIPVIFPFPNEEMANYVQRDGHKTLSPKVIPIPLVIKLNQGWLTMLVEPYKADTVYEWQLAQITIRQKALVCAEAAFRLLELQLQRKVWGKHADQALRTWNQCASAFYETDNQRVSFSVQDFKTLLEEETFKPLLESIQNWKNGFRNFISQLSGLISFKDPDKKRLALLNLRQAYFLMPDMQYAFEAIAERTFGYFDNDIAELEKQERLWHGRLRRIAEFYSIYATSANYAAIEEVAVTVSSYWKNWHETRYKKVIKCLEDFSLSTGYRIYKPSRLVEGEFGSHAVVGVEGLTGEEMISNFEYISISLAGMSDTEANALIIVACNDRKAIAGLKLYRGFFDDVNSLLDGKEISPDTAANVSPLIINEQIIETLPEVSWTEPKQHPLADQITGVYESLWQYVETSQRRGANSDGAQRWKMRCLTTYNQQAQQQLIQIRKANYVPIAERLDDIYKQVLDKPEEWDAKQLAGHLIETLPLLQQPII